MSPFSTLTFDHLVWRIENVTRRGRVVSLDSNSVTSFPELAARAKHCANALEAHGVTKDSRIASLAWSSADHLAVLLAAGLLGCVVTCINLRLSGGDVRRVLEDSDARILFAAPQVFDPSDPVGAELAGVLDAMRQPPHLTVTFGPAQRCGQRSFADFIDEASGVWRRRELNEDTAVVTFLTGGTTGAPKVILVTQRSLVLHALAQASVDALGIGMADCVLPAAPLFHVAGWGMPLTALLVGADLVLPGRDLDAGALISAMAKYEVTVAAAVPTLWVDVIGQLEAGVDGLPHLREVITGGSAIPADVVQRLVSATGATVAGAWGMTETLACSTYERDEPSARAGRLIPLLETRVVSGDGSETEVAGAGTLHIRGPFVHADTDGGWLDTQDVVEIDSHTGDIVINDRIKDLVKSGGEWISPRTLEAALSSHPGVAAAAVVAQPHPRWIERPLAFVVAHQGSVVTSDEMSRHLCGKVPAWWIPDEFRFVDSLPLTGLGKVDKQMLRNQM